MEESVTEEIVARLSAKLEKQQRGRAFQAPIQSGVIPALQTEQADVIEGPFVAEPDAVQTQWFPANKGYPHPSVEQVGLSLNLSQLDLGIIFRVNSLV